METKDIVINQDLLVASSKTGQTQVLADCYKWYLHLQYITYIEGVAMFLVGAAEVDDGLPTVSLNKEELRLMGKTLLSIKTY